MPLEIKAKNGKDVLAIAIVGTTIRCGHCDMPLLDNQGWFAFDAPYNCIVHEGCVKHFEYDKKSRAEEEEKNKVRMQLSENEQIVGQFMSGPWFGSKIPSRVQVAWVCIFKLYLLLRELYGDEVNKKLKKAGTEKFEAMREALIANKLLPSS